jgi:hypothetical protein
MSQRNSEYDRLPGDSYQTPAWPVLALLPFLPAGIKTVLEPAAGEGQMVDTLRAAGFKVTARDISDGHDFLKLKGTTANSIITNPPYTLAEPFIRHALALTKPQAGRVAMLLRCDYDHARGRADLFKHPPFALKLVLTRRIVWFDRPGAAPSFNHAWYLWNWRHKGPPTIAYGSNDPGTE